MNCIHCNSDVIVNKLKLNLEYAKCFNCKIETLYRNNIMIEQIYEINHNGRRCYFISKYEVNKSVLKFADVNVPPIEFDVAVNVSPANIFKFLAKLKKLTIFM